MSKTRQNISRVVVTLSVAQQIALDQIAASRTHKGGPPLATHDELVAEAVASFIQAHQPAPAE